MKFDLNRVIKGRVWKFGDSVDTDSMNPFYKYSTMEELKRHTLESFRAEFPKRVKPGDIIVAGRNFGCGSHRPATVLREVGIAAILVESAARLFLRNTIALPMPIYVVPGINNIVQDGEILEVDYGAGVARNTATGATVAIPSFPPMIEQIYACGGLPQLARQRYVAETSSGGQNI
jgi:3-isopropylmalate/(R)-2-methylmalate dehydratase small subunit